MHQLKYRREMSHWTEFVRMAQMRACGRWFRPLMMVAGALPIVLGIAVSSLWPGRLEATSFILGVLLAMFLVSAVARVFGAQRHVKNAGWILGEREISLSDESFVDAGNGGTLTVEWPSIEEVTLGKSIVVLWMDRAAGVFIPRNAFASADDERNFVDFAASRLAA